MIPCLMIAGNCVFIRIAHLLNSNLSFVVVVWSEIYMIETVISCSCSNTYFDDGYIEMMLIESDEGAHCI